MLVEEGGARLVTRAKKARSAFRGGQGRVPRKPRPREGVVATMSVKGGREGVCMIVWGMRNVVGNKKWD